MISRDDMLKEKMNNYMSQILTYELPENDKSYLLEHTTKLFTLKNIDDEQLVYRFLQLITDYYQNAVQLMFKKLSNSTTSNKRKSAKKQKALQGAKDIIDYLGGVYYDNENAQELKNLLHIFIRNSSDFEVKEPTHNITKDDLRNELRQIFSNKSAEIDEFVKGLKNYKL